jgi:hypothetical protein
MFARFCALFLFLTVVLTVGIAAGTIAFVRSDLFQRSARYVYDVLLAEKADARAPNTDLLIVGDSSLLTGVMPDLIDQRLGRRSYNLGLVAFAGYEAMLLATRRFVEINGRPETIVLYLSPAAPTYGAGQGRYEHAVAHMRFDSLGNVVLSVLNRPNTLSTVLETLLRRLGAPSDAFAARSYRRIAEALIGQRGYLSLDTAGMRQPVLAENCPLHTPLTFADDWKDALFDLRTRMQALAKHVLIYVAPMPACDKALEQARTLYAGLADNEVRMMRSGLFVDYIHLTPEGAAINSATVAGDLGRLIDGR